jgi:hypothetical protein
VVFRRHGDQHGHAGVAVPGHLAALAVLGLSSLIRGLAARFHESKDELLIGQIHNLRHRLALIRRMQALGVASIFFCVSCMFALFAGSQGVGKALFGTSLILLMSSLAYSFVEIRLSTNALNIELSRLEQHGKAAP